jgi:hypothetical protein
MMLRQEIVALRARIARKQAERDTWRATGNQAKYMKAFCEVEALELQLERLRQEGLRTSMKHFARAPVSAPDAPQSAKPA